MDNYTQKLGIKAWAEADRPREKLLLQGRRQLTDAELLAILIGSGNKDESAVDLSRRMLGFYQNDLAKLAKLNVASLCKFKGIGEAKAISIIAALELGRRRKEIEANIINDKISSSRDAYFILRREMADLLHEEFWILLLNKTHRVIVKQPVSRGGQDGVIVDPKVIFKLAFEQNAASIIMAHNHPSGNLRPSEADIKITNRMLAAGKVLELPVIDHLIITDFFFFSFADEGLM
ncbi:MAG: DNA repair protein RadC [Bacteroidota bacterium]